MSSASRPDINVDYGRRKALNANGATAFEWHLFLVKQSRSVASADQKVNVRTVW